MRVIVINDHGSVTGGAAQVAIASLNALANAGIDVTFVSSVAPVDTSIDQSKVRVINFGSYELMSNPSKLDAMVHGIWDGRCANRLGSLLDEYDPRDTIIHLHTWSKSLTSSVVRIAYQKRFKLACTLHDYFTVCPNGGLYNYVKQKHCNVSPMSLSCLFSNCDARSYPQKLWRYGREIVQQQIGGIPSHVANFISISNYSEKILRPFLPKTAKIYRVNNPISIDKMLPSSPAESPTFCFVGRLSPEKGARLFAQAAKQAKVQAAFVGCGEEEQSIRAIYPAAQLRGWQNHNAVISSIRTSRALVFPSLWHETQGLAVMEAAALGVPAIVSDDCAAKDYVEHGETGYVFKSGNADDLAHYLSELKNNPQNASQMGVNAFERYWANPCTLEAHLTSLVQCYIDILS